MKSKNLRTIGSVFAALAMLTSSQAKSIPVNVSTPIGQEQKKDVVIIDDARKKVTKKKEIDFQGGTADGMFRLAFHSSPFFDPTRSQKVKNKLNRKYYK